MRSLSACVAIFLMIGSLMAPAGAAGRRHHHVRHTPKKASAPKIAAPVRSLPGLTPVVGTWYITQNGKESHDQRLCLRADGTFAFVGSVWQSKGAYQLANGLLELQWQSIDGSPVKLGSIHRTLTLNAAMNAFSLDQYQYTKHSSAS